MNKDTSIPAFPQSFAADRDGSFYTASDKYGEYGAGMTLRDWFAGQALMGLCSAQDTNGNWMGNVPRAAEEAYKMADAMLAERSKQ